jgi:hypothetical protein
VRWQDSRSVIGYKQFRTLKKSKTKYVNALRSLSRIILKASFHTDKVIVACNKVITEQAKRMFRAWEDRERRRLVFWDAALKT